jgi:hypothetical protein
MVHMEFPENRGRAPLRLSWYDGGLTPPRPAGLRTEDARLFQRGGEGVLYVGDQGILLGAFNGQNPRIYPESKTYQAPPRQRGGAPPPDRAVDQWIAACKGGPAPQASFEAQAPVTEAFLLGCLAQRLAGTRLDWDSSAMRVTSPEAANRFVDPPYRGNWS